MGAYTLYKMLDLAIYDDLIWPRVFLIINCGFDSVILQTRSDSINDPTQRLGVTVFRFIPHFANRLQEAGPRNFQYPKDTKLKDRPNLIPKVYSGGSMEHLTGIIHGQYLQ